MKILKEGDEISFTYNGRIYDNKIGKYYYLGTYDNGMIQVSENKSFETMGFAQNWLIKSDDII